MFQPLEPIGSMSSMEVNVDMLEQMDLTDVSDHEALDVFLNSGGEDNSAASPVSGTPAITPTTHTFSRTHALTLDAHTPHTQFRQ